MADDRAPSSRPAGSGRQAPRSSGGGGRRRRRRRSSASGSGRAATSRAAAPSPIPPQAPPGRAAALATAPAGRVEVARRDFDDTAEVVARNGRRAVVVATLPGFVLLVVAAVLGLVAGSVLVGAIAGVLVGVAAAVALWRWAGGLVLRSLGVRPVDEDDVPGPASLVEGLCASMGLALPALYLVDDPLPNALAVARGPQGAVLVLTTGLLGALDPVELEAVLAHELAHVKRDDIAPATVAAALVLVVMVVPGGSGIVHRIAGRGREFATDRQAVRVTRYPPGLRQALTVLSGPLPAGGSTVAARRVGQVTRWLWTTVLPDSSGRRPEGDETIGELDAPSVRVAALDEW